MVQLGAELLEDDRGGLGAGVGEVGDEFFGDQAELQGFAVHPADFFAELFDGGAAVVDLFTAPAEGLALRFQFRPFALEFFGEELFLGLGLLLEGLAFLQQLLVQGFGLGESLGQRGLALVERLLLGLQFLRGLFYFPLLQLLDLGLGPAAPLFHLGEHLLDFVLGVAAELEDLFGLQ